MKIDFLLTLPPVVMTQDEDGFFRARFLDPDAVGNGASMFFGDDFLLSKEIGISRDPDASFAFLLESLAEAYKKKIQTKGERLVQTTPPETSRDETDSEDPIEDPSDNVTFR